MSHSLGLSKKIEQLRAMAAAIYDSGLLSGMNKAELLEQTKPFRERLELLITNAAKHDVPGCALAIKELEGLAMSHERTAEVLEAKAADARAHAHSIRRALNARMVKEQVHTLSEGGFFVTRTVSAQGSAIEIR